MTISELGLPSELCKKIEQSLSANDKQGLMTFLRTQGITGEECADVADALFISKENNGHIEDADINFIRDTFKKQIAGNVGGTTATAPLGADTTTTTLAAEDKENVVKISTKDFSSTVLAELSAAAKATVKNEADIASNIYVNNKTYDIIKGNQGVCSYESFIKKTDSKITNNLENARDDIHKINSDSKFKLELQNASNEAWVAYNKHNQEVLKTLESIIASKKNEVIKVKNISDVTKPFFAFRVITHKSAESHILKKADISKEMQVGNISPTVIIEGTDNKAAIKLSNFRVKTETDVKTHKTSTKIVTSTSLAGKDQISETIKKESYRDITKADADEMGIEKITALVSIPTDMYYYKYIPVSEKNDKARMTKKVIRCYKECPIKMFVNELHETFGKGITSKYADLSSPDSVVHSIAIMLSTSASKEEAKSKILAHYAGLLDPSTVDTLIDTLDKELPSKAITASAPVM